MASEQFNSVDDDSPVWEAYRVTPPPLAQHADSSLAEHVL